jgi:general stress protein 26
VSDDARTLDDLLDGERTAMVVTADQRARPMTVIARDEDRLWFLTTRSAEWVGALENGEFVAIVVVDPSDSLYLSLTGRATLTDDAATLQRLWNPAMEAWFDGADDPDLIALAVDVHEGEYWDGPGTGVGRALRGLASVVTGRGRELMGEQGDVAT